MYHSKVLLFGFYTTPGSHTYLDFFSFFDSLMLPFYPSSSPMVGCLFASPLCDLEKDVFMLKTRFLFVGIYPKVSMDLYKKGYFMNLKGPGSLWQKTLTILHFFSNLIEYVMWLPYKGKSNYWTLDPFGRNRSILAQSEQRTK